MRQALELLRAIAVLPNHRLVCGVLPFLFGDELFPQPQLVRIRITIQRDAIHRLHPFILRFRAFELRSVNEVLRLLDQERAVHEKQRLLGHGGRKALRAGRIGAGEIKGPKQARQILALDESINRPPWR